MIIPRLAKTSYKHRVNERNERSSEAFSCYSTHKTPRPPSQHPLRPIEASRYPKCSLVVPTETIAHGLKKAIGCRRLLSAPFHCGSIVPFRLKPSRRLMSYWVNNIYWLLSAIYLFTPGRPFCLVVGVFYPSFVSLRRKKKISVDLANMEELVSHVSSLSVSQRNE